MLVAIGELKSHLTAYLQHAQAGEEVIVTSHGSPVARLVGLGADRAPAAESLEGLPWVRPGQGGKPLGLPATERLRIDGGACLSDLLLEDRA